MKLVRAVPATAEEHAAAARLARQFGLPMTCVIESGIARLHDINPYPQTLGQWIDWAASLPSLGNGRRRCMLPLRLEGLAAENAQSLAKEIGVSLGTLARWGLRLMVREFANRDEVKP